MAMVSVTSAELACSETANDLIVEVNGEHKDEGLAITDWLA
jgi:hypothetical protein